MYSTLETHVNLVLIIKFFTNFTLTRCLTVTKPVIGLLIVFYTNLQVTAIADLSVGEEIKAESSASGVYSDSNFQTSMMGFLYSPASQSGVAWAVYCSFGWTGPIDAIPWNTVIVNQGEFMNVNVIVMQF